MSRIRINRVRLGYPVLFTPKGFKGNDGKEGTPKYSATFYLDKKRNKADIAAVKAEIAAVQAASTLAKHKFPAEKVALREVPEDKIDEEGKITGTDMVAADTLILSASNASKVTVVNKNKEQTISEADDIIYAGCVVNASISFWVQDNQWGKRINGSLEGVQFFGDSGRFGRPPLDATKEFENIEDEEEDDPRA